MGFRYLSGLLSTGLSTAFNTGGTLAHEMNSEDI